MLYTTSCRGAAQRKLQLAVAQCPACTAPLTHSLSKGFIQQRGVLYPNLAKVLFLGGMIAAQFPFSFPFVAFWSKWWFVDRGLMIRLLCWLFVEATCWWWSLVLFVVSVSLSAVNPRWPRKWERFGLEHTKTEGEIVQYGVIGGNNVGILILYSTCWSDSVLNRKQIFRGSSITGEMSYSEEITLL